MNGTAFRPPPLDTVDPTAALTDEASATPSGRPPNEPARPSRLAQVTVAVLVLAALITVCVVVARTAARSRGTAVQNEALGFVHGPSTTRPPRTTTSTSEPETTTTAEATTTTTSPEQQLAAELDENLTASQLVTPPKPAERGGFSFLEQTGGVPVGFNPCRTVHYVVRIGTGPANGLSLVQEALARISSLTGLQFAFDGLVTTVPTWEQLSGGGKVDLATAYKPIFIGWATPKETNIWARQPGDALGVGGPTTIELSGGARLYVSGFAVLLPTPVVTGGFGPGLTTGNVLLHELGHVVGLGHTPTAGELMEPELTATTGDGYGPGDRRGLWSLGASQGCFSSRLAKSGPR